MAGRERWGAERDELRAALATAEAERDEARLELARAHDEGWKVEQQRNAAEAQVEAVREALDAEIPMWRNQSPKLKSLVTTESSEGEQ